MPRFPSAPSPPPRQPSSRSRSRSRSPGARLYNVRRARSPSPRGMPAMSIYSRNEEPVGNGTYRDRDSYRIPALLAPWEYHADYGLIHPSGCDICSAYMKHCADASYSDNQPAFQMALKERKRYNEDIFASGVTEGRRHQKSDEKDLLDDVERYRMERNLAREEIVCLRSQLESSQAEYARLEERVKQLETARATAQSCTYPTPPPTETHAEQIAPSQVPSAVDLESVGSPSDAGHSSEVPSPIPFGQSSLYDLVATVTSQPCSPPTNAASVPSGPDAPPIRTFAHVTAASTPVTTLNSTLQGTSNTSLDPAWTVVAPPRVTKPPKSIKQLQSLMKAAHQAGNQTALRKVKALCAEAHQTPRDHKTDIQRYLLTTWRTPEWDSGNPCSQPAFPAPLNNPRLEDPPERWVEYYAANPSSCPKGIRREADGRPVLADMKASRTVARLRPLVNVDDPESRQARQDFMTAITRLFSVRGAYETILRRTGIDIASQISYTPYSSVVADVTIQGVARHFALCGISCLTAENELGPWAREYMNDNEAN